MADKKKPSCVFYFSWLNTLDLMTEQEGGRLLLALLRYGETGEVPSFREDEKHLSLLFSEWSQTIARDTEKYNEISKRRSESAKKRYEQEKAQKSENNQTDDIGLNYPPLTPEEDYYF